MREIIHKIRKIPHHSVSRNPPLASLRFVGCPEADLVISALDNIIHLAELDANCVSLVEAGCVRPLVSLLCQLRVNEADSNHGETETELASTAKALVSRMSCAKSAFD